MPFVYITTNVPRAKMPKDFNKLATTKFAQLIGQPEEYMAIIVNAGADLAMCGTEEPAAVLNVRIFYSSIKKNLTTNEKEWINS